ncbi:MAG: FAD-dependent monooxygenase, partial [Beijerinckiaceae bacterium]
SLYFDYPHFDAPAARENLARAEQVVIAGAGPVGMVAALTLAQHGVRSVLLERKSTFNDGSRAICVSRSSCNLFQTLGIETRFLDKGLPWTSGRSFFRGRQILEFFMADTGDEKYRPMYNLEQQYIEAFIHEAVAASDLIGMRWQSELTAMHDTGSGLVLSVRDAKGAYELPAQWLLAADGARSSIRTMRGLRLSGENYEGRYVIADIRLKRDCKVERFALFDPDCRPGGTVLVHQQPENIWRIDYQLRDGESEADALREESIRASIAGVLADIGFEEPWELEWWSIYSANTLALDDYRSGRVFFIGDSAHIVPIFGVRGLNNGILDAHNIGWKLAAVLKGEAQERILDSYTPERRGATLDVFANASKSARFMTPPTRGYEVLRDAALSLALDHPFAGEFANPRNMTPYTIADSPLTFADTDAFAAGPPPGAVALNVRLEGSYLFDAFGPGFNVLYFGELEAVEKILAVLPGTKAIPQPASGPAATLYGATIRTAYLLRPDGHVAARWLKADGESVAACLRSLLSGGREAE